MLVQGEYHAIDLLRDHYGARIERGSGAPLFSRLDWFAMLAEHCFAGQVPVIGEVSEGNAAALLLLIDEGDRLSALANYYSFSFAPLFVDAAPDQRRTLLTQIAQGLRARRRPITLYPVLDEDDMAQSVIASFRAAGWIVQASDMGHNHVLRLNGRNFAAYWAGRPGRLRNGVQRKLRDTPLRFAVHRDVTDTLWAQYLAVYARSWKPAEPHPDLLHALARDAARRGALRLAFAYNKDEPVAVQLWTIEGHAALIHKVAHDGAHDALSPGTLLAHHMFAQAIDVDHVAMIDYGTGDNDYKREWMEEERPMWRIDCFDPHVPSHWLPAVKAVLSGLVRGRNRR